MSNQHPELGKRIEGEAARDAIHIAVAPVVAAERLKPGQHVGFIEGGNIEKVGSVIAENSIGIVDPFLTCPVQPGERFWMCLYPKSTINLRHDWDHPSFIAAAACNTMLGHRESEEWLKNFADDKGISYTEMIRAAAQAQRAYDGRSGYLNSTLGIGDADTDVPDEFWDHFQKVTGERVKLKDSFFSCSC